MLADVRAAAHRHRHRRPSRLAERYPETFGSKQHSIVQRLLRALRKKAAETLLASADPVIPMPSYQEPRAVDGSGYGRPDPPTASGVEQASPG